MMKKNRELLEEELDKVVGGTGKMIPVTGVDCPMSTAVGIAVKEEPAHKNAATKAQQ